jgi:putative SOS response-associated peptidase YedK
MCGRFTLTADPNQLRQAFPWLNIPDERLKPRYNVAPTQPIAVVANDGKNQLDYYVWGLIPFWAKDPSIGNRMINARSETIAEKASFRAAFRRRRCLVLADGFYEWKSEPKSKSKTPMYIKMKNDSPFVFAGLWENWNSPDGSNILSCTIITTRPNDMLLSIHNRMPVILPEKAYPIWLDPGEPDQSHLLSLLEPYPDQEMTAYPVSRLVNNPANDSADCIIPFT